jgi:hypothetical protein
VRLEPLHQYFFGDQNKTVLINPDGSYTERSIMMLANTPINRFGDINEINGAVHIYVPKLLCL